MKGWFVVVKSVNCCQINDSSTRRKKYYYQKALPLGFAILGADIAVRGFKKTNRCDSFIKSAKNCIKDYTKEYRGDFSSFFKDFLKLEKAGNWIEKIGNKKMLAFLLVSETLLNASVISCIHKWLHPNKPAPLEQRAVKIE